MKVSRRKAIEKTLITVAGATLLSNLPKSTHGSEKKSKDIYLLKRNIPVSKEYDVVVAGGGPAGVAAAICGSRLGAKVLLIEATGCLGGMGTSGLVTAFDPMANGEELLVGGFMREVLFEMYDRGFLGPNEKPEIFTKKYHHWTKFNAEGYKLLLDEKVLEANVEVRFFTKVIDAEANKDKGRVDGVIVHNIEGYVFIPSKTFIDCTGDAVLADLCGADCREAGRDTPNIMPASLTSYFTNIDFENSIGVGTGHPILLQAIKDGHFTQPDKHLPGCSAVGNSIGYLNGGHIFNLNALRCDSLTRGMMSGRKIAKEYLEFYRKYVPGFENTEHACTASLMGVRESRRIVGEYELTFQDYISKREFPDQIGIFNKFVDIHPYDTSEKEYNRFLEEKDKTGTLKKGEYFGIPYSILVPSGWKNLWVAGRCNSSDLMVHGSIRVQPAASMMGQAAGTAAVQAINTGQPANDLNTEMLVSTLRNEGANLPQKELSTKMTRA
jgi:hypothetical protein